MGASDPTQVLNWITVTILSMAAFVLPRQFHVGVIENSDPSHVRTAQWLTPLYLLVINLFVIPIALGGKVLASASVSGDQYVLALPVLAGEQALSLAVFVGGFSAAIGMIMIEGMTMATMSAEPRHLAPCPSGRRWSALAASSLIRCALGGGGGGDWRGLFISNRSWQRLHAGRDWLGVLRCGCGGLRPSRSLACSGAALTKRAH